MGNYNLLKSIFVLVVALLLVGCGSISFVQKIYPDWTFDLSVEVSSDNEYFLNAARSSFEESPSFEKATLVELDNGFRYNLEKVSVEETATSEQGAIYESIGIKKEFKFPYYYYTITLKNKGIEDNEFGSFGMSMDYNLEPFGKITDTNGVYIGDDKKSVKFNLLKEKEYYITFRHFFLSSLLSGTNKIVDREAKETNIPRADTNLPSTEADETSTQEIGFIATVNGFGKENVIGNCDEYGFDCNQAGIGKIFLIIDITVENRGATNDFFENYISPSSFRIKDGDGYVYERAYVYSLEQEFPSGEIPIGEKVRGKIAFELPTAATGLKLEFEGSNIDLN